MGSKNLPKRRQTVNELLLCDTCKDNGERELIFLSINSVDCILCNRTTIWSNEHTPWWLVTVLHICRLLVGMHCYECCAVTMIGMKMFSFARRQPTVRMDGVCNHFAFHHFECHGNDFLVEFFFSLFMCVLCTVYHLYGRRKSTLTESTNEQKNREKRIQKREKFASPHSTLTAAIPNELIIISLNLKYGNFSSIFLLLFVSGPTEILIFSTSLSLSPAVVPILNFPSILFPFCEFGSCFPITFVLRMYAALMFLYIVLATRIRRERANLTILARGAIIFLRIFALLIHLCLVRHFSPLPFCARYTFWQWCGSCK